MKTKKPKKSKGTKPAKPKKLKKAKAPVAPKRKRKKPAKRKRPAKRKPRLNSINVKLLHKTEDKIQAKADRHAGKNFSAWLRYTGLNYTPKKGEKIPLSVYAV